MSVEPNSKRVLIVDQSAESREVLRTLLERTGTATLEATGPGEGATLAESSRPNLIVYDADSDHTPGGEGSRQLADTATRMATPIVLLGRIQGAKTSLLANDHLAKPYHYGQLLRKIADVLDEHRAA